MNSRRGRQFPLSEMLAAVFLFIPFDTASHGYAGKRIFPTTLAIDDPFVMDEFSVLADHFKEPGTDETYATQATTISFEYTARLTRRLGLLLGGAFGHLEPESTDSVNALGNLEVGAKYQCLTDAAHEAIASVGLQTALGSTGISAQGNSFTTLFPAVYFGKGMGDLPASAKHLRPLAVTGIFGAEFPVDSRTATRHTWDNVELTEKTHGDPTILRWGFSVQYSLQYLHAFVSDTGLEAPYNQMIPEVEFAMQSCLNAGCQGEMTGTVNPGLIWFGRYVQLGIAAQIPINARTGNSVGVLALFHLFMDDIFADFFPNRPWPVSFSSDQLDGY